jgi:arabinogalactan oligomer/maltooligosaccharide transport system permease protein
MSENTKSLRRSQIASNTAVYIILTVLSIIWLLPIAWLILSSFRLEGGAFVKYVWPKQLGFDNYVKLFTNTERNFVLWCTNTLTVAIFSCILSTLFTLCSSFALSRMRFKMRKTIMNIALILGMFPGFMSMIAIYHILKLLNLNQSLVALVLVYSGGAGLNYHICKGFFDTIPKELDEAAMIDGATRFRIFWQITIPLSKPMIIYTVLTSFLAPWTDFIFASFIMQGKSDLFTVSVGLWSMLERESISEWYLPFCAGAVVISIPITALFLFMQKYYAEGVTAGAVKG